MHLATAFDCVAVLSNCELLEVNYQDMEALDPDYYRNLRWMIDNTVEVMDACAHGVGWQGQDSTTCGCKAITRNIERECCMLARAICSVTSPSLLRATSLAV
eukprot:1693536-Amphidinium_carterae.2